MAKEIERRFLLKHLPLEVGITPQSIVYQHYISQSPDVRVEQVNRQNNNLYYLMCKTSGGLERDELELTIDQGTFMKLKASPNCTGMLSKAWWKVEISGHIFDISVGISPNIKNLGLVEIEFENMDDADHFNPGKFDFIGKEVTNDGRYNSRFLAYNGMPLQLKDTFGNYYDPTKEDK